MELNSERDRLETQLRRTEQLLDIAEEKIKKVYVILENSMKTIPKGTGLYVQVMNFLEANPPGKKYGEVTFSINGETLEGIIQGGILPKNKTDETV